MQYSLSIDCIILVWRLLDLVMDGNAGRPVLSLLMGIIVLMVFERSFTGASTGSSGWPIRIHIIRKEWMNLETLKSIESQIVSTPAKGQHPSIQDRT
jgi:hypothetical protein